MRVSLPDDTALISEAAAALDTSEIAIFRRAWAHWYGQAPDESRIEPPFLVYMFDGRAPSWARDYARRVVRRHRSEAIDPYAWGSRSGYARNPVLGLALALCAVAILVALVMVADYSAQFIGGIDGCLTPPCYGSLPPSP